MCSFCIRLEFGSESTVMCVNNVVGNMKWKRYVWSFPVVFCVKGFVFFFIVCG